MRSGKGLLIAIYGPDGVGKHTQSGLLEERIREHGKLARSVRYPVYDLEPSGKLLDEIIHGNKKKPPEEEMQKLFAQNRQEFEKTLVSWMDSGVNVVAENYRGTGIVWGVVRGLDPEMMEKMNSGFSAPDIEIVIDGPRREEFNPGGHPYSDEDEWYKVRKMYLAMADKYGWIRVGGDAPLLTVTNRIWAVVKPVLTVR